LFFNFLIYKQFRNKLYFIKVKNTLSIIIALFKEKDTRVTKL
jgi:hypothetical protein